MSLKGGMKKLEGDLHTKKDSHVSLDLKHAEWHIRNEDMNIKTKPGKNYIMHTPVVNTTQDKEANRFRGISKSYFFPLGDEKKSTLGKAADKVRNKEV